MLYHTRNNVFITTLEMTKEIWRERRNKEKKGKIRRKKKKEEERGRDT